MNFVIKEPVLTEKSNAQREESNQYSFVVDDKANKIEIAKAVEAKFKVEVESVNTVKNHGKLKVKSTKFGRISGRTPRYKKAIVTLKKGQKIDLFEQI